MQLFELQKQRNAYNKYWMLIKIVVFGLGMLMTGMLSQGFAEPITLSDASSLLSENEVGALPQEVKDLLLTGAAKEIVIDVDPKTSELIVTSDSPTVTKKHLFYAGAYFGIPLFGADLTYFQLQNEKVKYHLSASADVSLSFNANTLTGAWHPFQKPFNAFYAGGTFYYIKGVNQQSYGLGPEVGFAGGKRRVTGLIAVSLFPIYDPAFGTDVGLVIKTGIRIRLFSLK